jgi:CelD/BcsL family acetyltransferase involved in cellulose biosynthesis
MNKTIVEDFKDFDVYQEKWEKLLDGLPADSPFLTFEWLSTWWKHYQSDKKLMGMIFKEGSEILGIIPLMTYRETLKFYPLRKISFVGRGNSDRADFIIGKDKGKVIDALIEFFSDDFRNWDILHLEQIPEKSDSLGILRHCARKRGLLFEYWEQTVCPYIILNQEQARSMEKRDGAFRKEIRKQVRRLQDMGKVSFSRSIFHKNINTLIDTAAAVDLKSHKFAEGKTLFTDPVTREYLRDVADVFSKRKWLDFATLELDDVPIAYEYHFRYKEKNFAYSGSYDEAYASFGPGTGIMYRLVQDSIDLGLREYDLLQGGHEYKWRWTDQGRKHFQVMIINNTHYARLFHYLKFKARKEWREKTKEEFPEENSPTAPVDKDQI